MMQIICSDLTYVDIFRLSILYCCAPKYPLLSITATTFLYCTKRILIKPSILQASVCALSVTLEAILW